MNIKDALAQFDPSLSLDELPIRCSKCGGRQIDVRANYRKGSGGQPTRASGAFAAGNRR